MDYGLKGKVAIVTGAARGLGAATAHELAREGCSVVVNDINVEVATATVAAIKADGLKAHFIPADVTKSAEVQKLVDETVATFGSVHILVNNAGFPRDRFITKMTEEDWDLVVDVILKGSFLTSKAVIPRLIEQKWGRIINISSRSYLGNPTQANYSAAKAGMLGMARALMLEEGRYNITVNSVIPGFMDTEMTKSHEHYEVIKERAIKSQPIQRVGLPGDIAYAVAFLASERASFITGEALHVTGGRYG
jgi:3-oxoacyl-[acyl-carrier protein] reductase